MMRIKKYRCPCCGCYTLDEELFDICPVCFRENGFITDINTPDGTNNGLTLAEMRNNYQKYNVYNRDFIHCVRLPFKNEISDTDSEYIFCEIDYPDFKQITEMLNKVISGELTKTAVSLWAGSFLDLSYDSDIIDGYYEINQEIKAVLSEILDWDDDDEKTDDNIKDMLNKLSLKYRLKGCE